MNLHNAEKLLRNYPALTAYVSGRRLDILSNYSAYTRSTETNHADPTGNRVVKILELSKLERALKITAKWLDNELFPDNRSLLLDVWRGYPWRFIARREGWQCMETWNQMTTSLANYMNRSAGPASGQDGDASAGAQGKNSLE